MLTVILASGGVGTSPSALSAEHPTVAPKSFLPNHPSSTTEDTSAGEGSEGEPPEDRIWGCAGIDVVDSNLITK